MIHSQEIHCPHCSNNDLVKNGKSSNGTQCWRCKQCTKYFRLEYRYNARKQGMYEKIIELTLNSSGVRDISRVLKIHRDTVTSVLKKNSKNEPIFSYYKGKRKYGKFGNRAKVQQ